MVMVVYIKLASLTLCSGYSAHTDVINVLFKFFLPKNTHKSISLFFFVDKKRSVTKTTILHTAARTLCLHWPAIRCTHENFDILLWKDFLILKINLFLHFFFDIFNILKFWNSKQFILCWTQFILLRSNGLAISIP